MICSNLVQSSLKKPLEILERHFKRFHQQGIKTENSYNRIHAIVNTQKEEKN